VLAGPEQPAGVAVAVAPARPIDEPDDVRAPGPEVAPWPGAIPPPAPARIVRPPAPVELLDGGGMPVRVSARGDASGAPVELRGDALPGGHGTVVGWAGPWVHDVRWWDPVERRRQARWQLVVRAAGDVDVACLVVFERGRAFLEAVYD